MMGGILHRDSIRIIFRIQFFPTNPKPLTLIGLASTGTSQSLAGRVWEPFRRTGPFKQSESGLVLGFTLSVSGI